MKNPVTILLLTIHLLAYTDLVQLTRFPNLIKHFQTHQHENPGLSFIDFLKMHYGICLDGKAGEGKEDMQLPFKTLELHLLVNAIVSPVLTLVTALPPVRFHEQYINYYIGNIPATIKDCLFRPPISAI